MANPTQTPMSVYRILTPQGTFRGSGHTGGKASSSQRLKTWNRPAEVLNHLLLHAHYSDTPREIVRKGDLEGCMVVEYELVERRRIPVEEFLAERRKP
jgi:hypothetical protein